MSGFVDMLNNAWNGDFSHFETCQLLFYTLKTKKVTSTSKSLFSKAELEIHTAVDIILRMNVA
jgi:hypothetical protein